MILAASLALNAAAKPFSNASICALSLRPAGLAAAGLAGCAPAAGAEAGGAAAFAAPSIPNETAIAAVSRPTLFIVSAPVWFGAVTAPERTLRLPGGERESG